MKDIFRKLNNAFTLIRTRLRRNLDSETGYTLIRTRLRRNLVNETGFTLIELLVVISIIGLLATLLLANFNSTRSRARDAQRKSDLRNIQTALRLYYNDFSKYPSSAAGEINGCGDGTDTCGWGTSFALTSGTTYMSVLPADLLDPDQSYIYTRINDDDYTLVACLENKSDAKCDKGVGGGIVACTAGDGCKYTVKP